MRTRGLATSSRNCIHSRGERQEAVLDVLQRDVDARGSPRRRRFAGAVSSAFFQTAAYVWCGSHWPGTISSVSPPRILQRLERLGRQFDRGGAPGGIIRAKVARTPARRACSGRPAARRRQPAKLARAVARIGGRGNVPSGTKWARPLETRGADRLAEALRARVVFDDEGERQLHPNSR
jgi:hypothetical protein